MESSSSPKEEQKPAKLLERIKRLETENKKLKEKLGWKTDIVDVKEEGTGNSQTEQSGSVQKEIYTYKEGLSIMTAVDELRKSLELSLDKISSDMKKMMEDSVDQKYEAEAIAIEKEEKWRREKTELIDEMRRLQQETEDFRFFLGGEAKPGWFSSTVSDEMFLLNSEKNGWIKLSLKLPKPFANGGAVYLNGEIHIFGGNLAKETYKLDKKSLKWIRLADMNEKCDEITSSCLEWNESIWVFGGWDGKKALKSVERYDPKENKWSFMTYMKNSRNNTAAAVHNGKFIVCGGYDVRKMAEDALLQMYEAQAIAIEQRAEADRLKGENEELTERLGRLQRKREEESGRIIWIQVFFFLFVFLFYSEMRQVHATASNIHDAIIESRNGIREQLMNMEKINEKNSQQVDDLNGDLGKRLETAVENNPTGTKEDAEDSVLEQNEAGAIFIFLIEKEREWMREREELLEEMRRLQQEIDERKLGESLKKTNGNQEEPMQKLEQEEMQLNSGKKTILILGGEAKPGWFSITELDEMFILGGDGWIKLPLKLPKTFANGGAVYLDGEIYIFGGSLGKETYKLNKNLKWIRLADMNEERGDIINSYLEWNGSIWVFGGYDLRSGERYDPKEDKWIKMPDMKHYRSYAAAAVHNDKFIVCGGWDDGLNHLISVECFDPESGVWSELNDMPTPLYGHSLVSHGNNLILMGGSDGKTVNTVLELSNLEGKGTWRQLPPMKQPRNSFSAAVLNNEIFVIGGYDTDKTEIFNGKSWREGPFLPNVCREMSSIVIPRHLADILSNYKE